jgi:hypothetical protein
LGYAWKPWREASDEFSGFVDPGPDGPLPTDADLARKVRHNRVELARRAAAWHRALGEDEQAEQLEAKAAEWGRSVRDARAENARLARLRW